VIARLVYSIVGEKEPAARERGRVEENLWVAWGFFKRKRMGGSHGCAEQGHAFVGKKIQELKHVKFRPKKERERVPRLTRIGRGLKIARDDQNLTKSSREFQPQSIGTLGGEGKDRPNRETMIACVDGSKERAIRNKGWTVRF